MHRMEWIHETPCTMNWKTAACDDLPEGRLGDAVGVDLDGCGLRSLVAGMTRHCTGQVERALALFDHVAQMRFVMSDLDTRCDPLLLAHLAEGDGFFKGTLMVHLLRLAGLPARLRWLQIDSGQLMRGLWDFVGLAGQSFVYPVTETCVAGRWICTDAYTLDAPLIAAVHRELDRRGWTTGFLAHRAGATTWDGQHDAMQRFDPAEPAAMQVQDLGCSHSHADFMRRRPSSFRMTAAMRLAFASQAEHVNHELGHLRLRG